jgi:hypothetical protein
MCEKVLDIDLQAFESDEFPTLVIRDLKESVEHANRLCIRDTGVRFYAGAPLISPAGAIVGSLCIFDDAPRPDGLSNEHRHNLRDIAQSIMDYMHTYTIKDQLWRGERFTRGLISFSEGAEALLPFENARQRESENPQRHSISSQALESPHDERNDPLNSQQRQFTPVGTATRDKSNQPLALKRLQDTILPTDAKSMFARAANVMMASSDLDGVVILDASVAANRTRRQAGSHEGTCAGTGTEEVTDSDRSFSSSSEEGSSNRAQSNERLSSKTCQILGYATQYNPQHDKTSATPLFGSILESDLTSMLQEYPDSKIITFGMDGLPLSSTDDSGSASEVKSSSDELIKRRSKGSRSSKISRAIQAMLPNARSVAFVPFWDYERSRWFAGCLCWSDRAHRLLSATVDLAYFKIFSHSVMRELSRLDALALNQLKTTFVASISHELRSPLHGILGTLEFIKDTPLDSFQTSMFNSLSACGQTLLDTMVTSYCSNAPQYFR